MNEEAEVPNLTADLESAWEDVEPAEDADDGTTTGTAQIQPEVAAAASPEGDAGDSGTGGGGDTNDPAVPGSGELRAGANEDQGSEKPPVGLSAAAREVWKDTPEAIRKDITKREADYTAGIEKHRQNSARAQQMDQVLAPYAQYFAMNGGAGPTINTLLQTGASLQSGTPQQKAQVVANIIEQYGVDIQTLDNTLVGKPPPEGAQQQSAINNAVQTALAPYQNFMNQQQQQQQQQVQHQAAEVTQTIDQFQADPVNEFYTDVRMDMADLLDMAANRNEQMSLKQAYDRACLMNPEITTILSTRANTNNAGNKRRAAVSISGGQGGQGGGTGELDMRATIEDAWSQAGRI